MNSDTLRSIHTLVEKNVKILGFEIVFIKWHNYRKVLEVAIEKDDGGRISLDDCQAVNRHLSFALDADELMEERYYLEVSSPGMDRPLVKMQDYSRFIGYNVIVHIEKASIEKVGAKKLSGVIQGVENGYISLKLGDDGIKVLFEDIDRANIVFTDEMFKDIMRKGNIK